MLSDERLLGRDEGRAHLLRVAPLPFSGLQRGHLDERGPEALHLFAHLGPRVERTHDRAQALGARDGGEPGDARAEDEDLGRGDAPCGGHLSSEETPEVARALDDRPIADDVGHRAQRVHLLRARDARDRVHREHRRLALSEALDERRVLPRPDEADERGAFLQEVGLVAVALGQGLGWPDLEDEVRLLPQRGRVRRNDRARLEVRAVAVVRRLPGPRLNDDFQPQLPHPGDGHRRRRDAPFTRVNLLRYPDPHPCPSAVSPARDIIKSAHRAAARV